MSKSEELPALSDAQLEILEVLWDRKQATVSEVWSEISARRSVARNTVLTLMERLEKKGWLKRHEEGPILHYSAARPRRQTLSQLARNFVGTMFNGSAENFLLALLDGKSLPPAEAERIRALIDQARRKS